MLQSIAERGRALVTRDRRGVAEQRSANLAHLCEDLLSRRGEASGVALAREILSRYAELKTGPRIAFFEALASGFGPDRARLSAAATASGARPPLVRLSSRAREIWKHSSVPSLSLQAMALAWSWIGQDSS